MGAEEILACECPSPLHLNLFLGHLSKLCK